MKRVVRKNAVMMEYVIIAVLVAAAVVVAVIMFGRTVSNEMQVATSAMVDASEAEADQSAATNEAKKGNKRAVEHESAIHNYSK